MNKRKDKIWYNLIVTKGEEKELLHALKFIDDPLMRGFSINKIAEILDRLNKRGDFEKR